jgi:hypothetical protein
MAQDSRYPGRGERGRWRGEEAETPLRERGPQWRGDPAFGDGWGNQAPRGGYDEGNRSYPPADRYARGGAENHDGYDSDIRYGGPGFNGGFGDRDPDRLDIGRAGSHGARPASSSSNAAYGFGPSGEGSARDRAGHHDPHYSEWRRRQIAALDSDYDEFRRENQSRFERSAG